MTRLRITEGERSRVVELTGRRVTLGRSEDCDVPLASSGVSRRHAELVLERGRWSVHDLGSANGTFLAGEAVEDATIGPGDEVTLGPDVTLELLSDTRGAYEESEGEPEDGAEAELADEDDADDADEPARGEPGGRGERWWRRTRWMLHPAEGGESIRLKRPVTTVGRDSGAGLVLEDASVSRMHARFDLEGALLTLTDLHSGNGTFVNDQRITVARVSDGDVVRFGEAEFHVERGEAGPLGGLLGG